MDTGHNAETTVEGEAIEAEAGVARAGVGAEDGALEESNCLALLPPQQTRIFRGPQRSKFSCKCIST
jgi:hypothetical protein